MKRSEMLEKVKSSNELWDMIIIGGGATGLGVAVDAANRGYKTLLLEMGDFSKGTSSRSTKLVHGGVRYLQQGNVSLVLEALRERGLLIQNAPHLCRNQAFIVRPTIGGKVHSMELASKCTICWLENLDWDHLNIFPLKKQLSCCLL